MPPATIDAAQIATLAQLFWGAGLLTAALLSPYPLLRIWAQNESWPQALMHTYLPWTATVLVIMSAFGFG